jgi:predicted nucleotidyltransferase
MDRRLKPEEIIDLIARIKKEVSRKEAGKLIYLTLSGSDLYGFPSADSDYDFRGAFLTDTNNVLGLHRVKDVLNMPPDIVLYELKKEIALCVKSNCNVLEHVNAPTIYSTPEFLLLKRLVNNVISRIGIYNSYKGMATFNYKKFIRGGKANPKKYLYVFRGLMAGIYVLNTGIIEPNLIKLNKYFKNTNVKTLIEVKKSGKEKGEIPKLMETGLLDEDIAELFERIDTAFERSKIPLKPSDEEVDELNSYLIQRRLDFLD